MEWVPNCWEKKNNAKIPITIATIVDCSILAKVGISFNPSIADVIVMGGVIMPSASNAAPPIIAGTTSHLRLLLTRA